MSSTVDSTLVADCVAEFATVVGGSSDLMVVDAFTESVTFDVADLMDYLSGLTATSVSIKPGIYTSSYVAEYPEATEGRMTVFLCPVPVEARGSETEGEGDIDPNDPPVDPPFNMGEMKP